MNRRSFLTGILKAGVSAMILPSALTYSRNWKIESNSNIFIPNPNWVCAQYELSWQMCSGVLIGPTPKALHRIVGLSKEAVDIIYPKRNQTDSIVYL